MKAQRRFTWLWMRKMVEGIKNQLLVHQLYNCLLSPKKIEIKHKKCQS